MDGTPLSTALTHLRSGDPAISAFEAGDTPHWHKFSTTTRADIFDVRDGKSYLHRDLDETALRRHLRDDVEVKGKTRRARTIFLDGDPNNAELLPITSDALEHIFKTYDIARRFAFFFSRQTIANSSMHYETNSQQPSRVEYWYTAVIRSLTRHAPDGSRKVMNWLRFFAWADFHTSTGSSTCLVFRYPVNLKERFFDEFAGPKAPALEQHPMLMHASWLERITTMSRDIHYSLCDPMYVLEEEIGEGSASSTRLFEIGRELTEIYRKIRQIKTDIDIVMGSTQTLRKQSEVLSEMRKTSAARRLGPHPNHELQMQLDQTFHGIEKELQLSAVYLSLYSERCNTSITIAHSLSSQRSAEVQLKSQEELTSLSRDSKEDNRSLRVIQLLGAVFLPSSLISSIFGMSFFANDVDDARDRAVFAVSTNWWWYPAVTLPVTAMIVLLIVRDWVWGRMRFTYEWGRKTSIGTDLEKALSRKSN